MDLSHLLGKILKAQAKHLASLGYHYEGVLVNFMNHLFQTAEGMTA